MTDLCLAPDPSPSPPRFELPAGACDTHVHFFGPRSAGRLVAARDYTPPEAPAAAARQMFDTFGIERFVVVQPSVHGSDNRDQLDEADEVGLPFRAIVVLTADATDAEIARLHARGARGIRYILAHPGGLDLAGLEHAAARAHETGWHLQFLLRPRDLVALQDRLAALPCPVVIDHLGFIDPAAGLAQPAFQALLRLLRGGRGWVKFSGAYRASTQQPGYADLKPYAEALLAARPDRILWGSDWPHVGQFSRMPGTTALLDLLADWAPTEADRRRILVDNPSALFGW